MSRTPLFAAVQKALARSLRDSSVVWPQSSALTRRKLLRLSAAAAGAAALSPVFEWSAYAKKKKRHGKHGPYSIAIIGGGVAGLTAAYRLQAAGAKPVVFEASNRWGGRMFTVYDFYKGMFCELGGEFVDTNHEDLQKLGAELGVEMQKLAAEGDGEDLYFFRGAWKTPKDMLDPAKQTGAFVPIAKQIAEDAGKLTDKDDNWTAHATKLDEMSLKAYLEQFRGKTDDWAIDLLDVAYNIEFGLETEDQSSLNMVDFIGSDLSKPFQMFGESDEVYRIKGGSSALIKALLAALENKVDMKLGQPLSALDAKGGRIVASFDAQGGTHSETFDAVILALPFTRLRQVKGLEGLRLGAEKLKAFASLVTGRMPRFCKAPPRACGGVPTRDFPHHRMAPSIPISASRTFARRAAPSLATPASSPTISAASWSDRHEDRTRRLPRRPPQDVAEDGRKSRPVCGHRLVLGHLSLHARQLRQRQGWAIHHDVGGGRGAGPWRPPAICRRAYQQRLSWLHERWSPKW